MFHASHFLSSFAPPTSVRFSFSYFYDYFLSPKLSSTIMMFDLINSLPFKTSRARPGESTLNSNVSESDESFYIARVPPLCPTRIIWGSGPDTLDPHAPTLILADSQPDTTGLVTDDDYRKKGWDIHYIASVEDEERVRQLINAANPIRARWRDHPEEFPSCTPAPSRACSPTPSQAGSLLATVNSIDSSTTNGTNVAECGGSQSDGVHWHPMEDEGRISIDPHYRYKAMFPQSYTRSAAERIYESNQLRARAVTNSRAAWDALRYRLRLEKEYVKWDVAQHIYGKGLDRLRAAFRKGGL